LVQRQDHFDGANTNTWLQAYYVNDTFWKPNSDAPVFICVGGEGPPLDGSAVVASVHCNDAVELAPSLGALVVALEHRYYGCHNMSACPVSSFDDPSSRPYRFLSSRQALADLAALHSYLIAQYALDISRNRFVSFGGSYPGMLASWFRTKFPHLIHAAVSSSAPVQAQVEMSGYNDVVASAFTVSDNNVGGSDACRDAVVQGHKLIGSMFSTVDGRTRLAKLFGQTADWYNNQDNQWSFAGEGVANFPAQSNDPSCTQPSCNIALICNVMLNQSVGDAVDRLALVVQQQSNTHDARSQLLSLAGVDSKFGDLLDSFWYYQTCTEFGFYQTCDVGSSCMWVQGLDTLRREEEMACAQFNISADTVADNVAFTNDYYGGDMPASSCILYVNGEVDPWHALSILQPPTPQLQTLWVPGASHHAWTHPSMPSDQQSVVAARQTIWQFVISSLNHSCLQPQ
jgi:hypothetical protein